MTKRIILIKDSNGYHAIEGTGHHLLSSFSQDLLIETCEILEGQKPENHINCTDNTCICFSIKNRR